MSHGTFSLVAYGVRQRIRYGTHSAVIDRLASHATGVHIRVLRLAPRIQYIRGVPQVGCEHISLHYDGMRVKLPADKSVQSFCDASMQHIEAGGLAAASHIFFRRHIRFAF